jgi:uncharacterized membrane protein YczE
MNRKRVVWRIFFYLAGTVLLSLGLTLNTKAELGTAPILTLPLALSKILQIRFSVLVFILYAIFTTLSFLLAGRSRDVKILLQFPFSFVFSMLLELWGDVFSFSFTSAWQQYLLLLVAMALTAVGVSCMINMELIANPADGFADTVGRLTGKGMGTGKNIVDITCAICAVLVGLAVKHRVVGVGIGTIISMIVVGRFISIFQKVFREKMRTIAGAGSDA